MATSCGLTEKDFEEQEQLQATSSQCADNSSAACNGSGACHTGDGRAATGSCRQQADQGRPKGSWARAAVTLGEEAQPAGPAPKPKHSTCVKCKQVQGVVSVRHGEAVCKACLDASVVHKIRTAKAKGAFLPHDRVLAAISGGCSSLAMLSCLLELRNLRPDKKEKGKIPIEVIPIHIQEGPVWGCTSSDIATHESQLRAAVTAAHCTTPLITLSLAAIMCESVTGATRGHTAASHTTQPATPSTAEPSSSQAENTTDALADQGAHQAPSTPDSAAKQASAPGTAAQGRQAVHASTSGRGSGSQGEALHTQPQGLTVTDNDQQAGSSELANGLHVDTALRVSDIVQQAGSSGLVSGSHVDTALRDLVPGRAEEEALMALVQAVRDQTGREDLIRYLRDRLLHEVARRLGCTKIAKGDCANTLAIRVISETAKGRGFSLPADIALSDARHGPDSPAVVLPCNDLTAKETVWFCRGRGIPAPVTLPVLPLEIPSARTSINQLAEAFVMGIQANVPSMMFTILRTAGALKPFPYNEPETANRLCGSASAAAAAAARHAAKHPQNTRHTNTTNGEGGEKTGVDTPVQSPVLCALCSAPLADDDLTGLPSHITSQRAPLEPTQQSAAQVASIQSQEGAQASVTAANGDHGASGFGVETQLQRPSVASVCCLSCRSQIVSQALQQPGVAKGQQSVRGDVGSTSGEGAQGGVAWPPFVLSKVVALSNDW